MKYIFIILFFYSLPSKATSYYVDTTGSDSNVGTSTSLPFKTASKAFSVAVPLDTIYFKSGQKWNERINIPCSNLTVKSYGSGVNPIISGFQTETGFTNVTGNIWQKVISGAKDSLNMVLINGQVAIKARYPNSTYRTFTGYVSDSVLIDTTLSVDYTGKEIAVRTSHWIIDIQKVKSKNLDTLFLSGHLTYAPNFSSLQGNGYFFQNDSLYVDSSNEYAYNKNTHSLVVYSVGAPTVQVSNNDTIIYASNKNNITFDGINFQGANRTVFQIDTCQHFTVKNSSINYSGRYAFRAKKSAYLTAYNDSIQNSLSDAFLLASDNASALMVDTCNNLSITYCYINNTGVYAGMGNSGNNEYMGIRIVGTYQNISNNKFLNTGYIPIYCLGGSSLISCNSIDTHNFVKDDGGGIDKFTGNGYGAPANYDSLSVIDHNIISNGIGANGGVVTINNTPASGIYLDLLTVGVTVSNNTLYNNFYSGINLLGAKNCTFRNNTIVDSATAEPIYINALPNPVSGIEYFNNIYYQKANTSKYLWEAGNTNTVLASDSNYYLRPLNDTNYIRVNNMGFGRGTFNLKQWQDTLGFDLHGGSVPAGITSASGILYTNPTKKDSTIILPAGLFIDAKGEKKYVGKIVLHPFESSLLFTSPITYKKSVGGFLFN